MQIWVHNYVHKWVPISILRYICASLIHIPVLKHWKMQHIGFSLLNLGHLFIFSNVHMRILTLLNVWVPNGLDMLVLYVSIIHTHICI